MKITTLAKSMTFAFTNLCMCSPSMAETTWTTFITPVKCKAFTAQIVSTCYPTRKDDEPAVCKSQILEFRKPVQKSIPLFKATRPPTKGEYLMIGRHAMDWFCSLDAVNQRETLNISVANWFNAQDEDIMMFDQKGHRLSKRQVERIANTPAWRAAADDREKDATAYGDVAMPKFK